MIKVKYRQKKNTQMIGEKKKERKKQINANKIKKKEKINDLITLPETNTKV